jgi:hypothetical protein
MAYIADPGGGYVGNYLTAAALEAQRPAAYNVGRIATVGTPQQTGTYYISAGNGWQPLLPAALDTSGNVTGLVGPGGGQVSIPALTFHAVGTVASPISTATMNATSGRVGPASNILIPANTLKVGSKVTGHVKYQKTGGSVTGSSNLYARLGTGNGSSDAVSVTCGIGIAFGTTGWMTFDFDITNITGTNTVLGSNVFYITNIGAGGDTTETTSATVDVTQPMYVSFTFSCGAIGAGTDAIKLLEYDVQVFS